jgi:hypothetical protein
MAVSTAYLARLFSLEAQGGSVLQVSRWYRSGKIATISTYYNKHIPRTQRGFDRAQGILSPTC